MKRPEETFGPADQAVPAVAAAMPIYVISLDRAPERRAHMRAQMARLGLAHEIVTAVDGREPIEGLERLYGRRQRLRTYGTDLTPAEIACCLSHLDACRRIAESGAQIGLVLEDDVVLSDVVGTVLADLAALEPRGFDVVRLAGLRERRGRTVRVLSGGHRLARLAVGPCGTQAYVITATGRGSSSPTARPSPSRSMLPWTRLASTTSTATPSCHTRSATRPASLPPSSSARPTIPGAVP